LIFVGLYWLFPKIREALAIVKPETVVRWHRAGELGISPRSIEEILREMLSDRKG
jgi:hypothetical protein